MAIEHIAPLDRSSLTAAAVPTGSRTLLVGAAGEVERQLLGRGCSVVTLAGVDDLANGTAGDAFDAVVVAEGFEHIGDPIGALELMMKAASDDGVVVLAVANAQSVSARARLLADAGSDSVVPARPYDLAAVEGVVGSAGYAVVDRLRVFAPVDEATTLPAEIAALVADHPESHTDAFVFVVSRARPAAESPSLSELLQDRVAAGLDDIRKAQEAQRAAEAELAATETTLVALRGSIAELEATVGANERELASRADALVERIEVIDRLHLERRHLELDIAVKNDYIADLRTELQTWQDLYGALRGEHDELLRSRHYRVAAKLHTLLRQVPFAHRIVRVFTKVVAKVVRPASALPPT